MGIGVRWGSFYERPFLTEGYSHVTRQRMKWNIYDTLFQKICGCNPAQPDLESKRLYSLFEVIDLVKFDLSKIHLCTQNIVRHL